MTSQEKGLREMGLLSLKRRLREILLLSTKSEWERGEKRLFSEVHSEH